MSWEFSFFPVTANCTWKWHFCPMMQLRLLEKLIFCSLEQGFSCISQRMHYLTHKHNNIQPHTSTTACSRIRVRRQFKETSKHCFNRVKHLLFILFFEIENYNEFNYSKESDCWFKVHISEPDMQSVTVPFNLNKWQTSETRINILKIKTTNNLWKISRGINVNLF